MSADTSGELLAVELRDGRKPGKTEWFAAPSLRSVREIALSTERRLAAAGGVPAQPQDGPDGDIVVLWDWKKARPAERQVGPMRWGVRPCTF